MAFKTVIQQNCEVNSAQFFKAISIWSHNPQTVNRRILASVELMNTKLNCDMLKVFKHINAMDFLLLATDGKIDDTNVANLLNSICSSCCVPDRSANKIIHMYVAKQLPRAPHIFSAGIEFFLLDEQENCVINIHKPFFKDKQPLGPKIAYMLKQEVDGCISICVYQMANVTHDSTIEWLENRFLPRILKWAKNEFVSLSTPLSSLSLVSAEKYAKLYCRLKEKYGKKLISNWPENTDPMKFVYEDIAIATYLLLLWEKERREKNVNNLQSFLDLGCGNGLLVYILFNEGHPGLGIDLRRRKIWDFYPPETPLQVSTVIPSSTTVYPGVNWIIGNHSDELTPWIPVIAARSSNHCRFFLLPCCSYELNGAKYQRYSAAKSQYSDYIEYVKNICMKCGFNTHIDKLRIPSTKRICLIGWDRWQEETEQREKRIQEMLSAKTSLIQHKQESQGPSDEMNKCWTCDFKPRDNVEKVRNCTQLDKTLITRIVDFVTNHLLHDGRIISLDGTQKKYWNAGKCVELREIAESIPKEMMICLRKECGGLQTLLKNHSHIFQVVQGKVEFRIPSREGDKMKSKKRKLPVAQKKTKTCWFHENHPNGCPAMEACNFKH